MSHTSWSSTAGMGSASPYHLDPSPGGAPVLSPDGHWRWTGDHWELRDDPDVEETESEAESLAEPVPEPAPTAAGEHSLD